MDLGKIKRKKKGQFDPITLLFVGIGALITYLIITNPTNGDEPVIDEPSCDGVCEAANPTPYENPPEPGWQSSPCSGEMKTASKECTPVDPDDPSKGQDCDYYCVPKECGDSNYEGYTCSGDDVCPDCWVDTPDGCNKCCSVPCVTPCGIGTNLECIPREEADTYDEDSIGGGFAICSNGCPDYDYAVEDSLGNNEWCMKCAQPSGTTCCIYCPPKTYYCPDQGKCVGACACYSCEKKSGLPFNSDEDSVSDYIDTGYSICKESCEDLNLGDGVVWKAYSIGGKADEWCSISNGGTDFEGYNKCCAYCPPETHYDPILLSCEPDSTVSELTWELNCPYIRLEWGEYENAVSYDILLFYDENGDDEEDGSCPEDEINTNENPYYYDLSESNCTEYYTENVKLLLVPQYDSGEISVDSDETNWIDVSSCEFEQPFDDCTDGTKHDECDDSGDGPNGNWDGDLTCNDDDPDKDGDGVMNPGDEEEWTIIGCNVDEDTGVAIDNDEDDICMGLDCNDYDAGIEITKEDLLCTKEDLCINQEKDEKTNEVVVDFGGSCRPYVEILKPEYGVSSENPFDFIVSTDHDAECKFSMGVALSYSNMQSFENSGGKEHKITDFSLDQEREYVVYLKCDDGYWDADDYTYELKLEYDSTAPEISTYYAEPNPIIESPVETVLVIGTDDETICKYSTESQEFVSMENNFPDFDKPNFSDKHTQTITLPEEAADYGYYVACKNKAGLVSDTAEIFVSIDLSQDLVVTSTTNKFTNESRIYLTVKTNKDAECFYNNKSEDITNSFGSSGYEHKHLISNLADGSYHYYVRCYKDGKKSPVTTIIFTVDTEPVEAPVVNDTSNIDEFPEYSYYADKIRAKWTLEEIPVSGIDYFIYKIEDDSENLIVNWTKNYENDEWVYVEEDHNGDKLNLTEGAQYFFAVKAKNKAGSVSEQGTSDGVIVDYSKEPAECDDSKKNGYETDVDCGGGECTKCDLTNSCLENSDCHSGFCNSSNMCAESGCDDGIKNGDETDVDCGGSCDKCENDEDCKEDSDCKSGKCDSALEICIGTDACSNNRFDEDKETDVDCGGYCAEVKDKKCSQGDDCEKNSDCSSGNCDDGKCASSVRDKDGDGEPDDTDNCPSISNKFQEDTDNDGIGDACDDDNDNDGMPDDWESDYGLSPGFDDSEEDEDNDGLTNYEEYREGTDPTKRDTDGDGVSDYNEVNASYDPTDPDDKPESSFWPWFLLILGIIFLFAGIGYLGYKYSTKPKKKKSFTVPSSSFRPYSGTSFRPPPTVRPHENSIELRRKQAMNNIRKDRERFKDHDKIFSTFESKPQSNANEKIHARMEIGKPGPVKKEPEKKAELKKQEPEKKTKSKKTTKKKTKKKIKKTKKKEERPKDVFERLSLVATAELKKHKGKKK